MTPSDKSSYNPAEIEPKWQAAWTAAKAFEAPVKPGSSKRYVLDMFPYPSGYGLHVGHLMGYTGTDVLARLARMQGHEVLHPMGWDAFGLPAENFAIKTGVHPALSTAENTPKFKRQLERVGFSYDWSREINTSLPEYYRWTQWLFQLLYKRGLAYRKEGMVNWCPSCQTVLANEQVVGGRCERCGAEVEQRSLKQWYFKITEYAERLLDGLNDVDWPEPIKTMQRNWIGKSEGARLTFSTDEADIEVFTTRPDTLFGATYLVLAPEHPAVPGLTTPEQKEAVERYQEETRKKSELERLHLEKEKTGVWIGGYAKHPLTGEDLPIWISDYVVATYGTGAIMAVPAHDERDFAFAKAFNLPIKQVIAPKLLQDTGPAKYRPEEPVVKGESVIVFLQHPTEEKYLGLDWKESSWGAKTLLTGTIEDLDPEKTALKEIAEETGYLNADIVCKLGIIDELFYHPPKQTNKLVRGHVFLIRLQDEKQGIVEGHEAARHNLKWLTKEELRGFLTPQTHQFALDWLDGGFQPYTGSGTLVNSGEFDGMEASEVAAAITAKAGGVMETRYRLRDWLVSRQRFWGAPIPVMYDESGVEHLVPEDQLPVELPMNVDFKPTGQSPLASANEWRNVCFQGKTYQREVDTLDTFVCSSWYFLRFPNPHVHDKAFDRDAVEAWLPVDVYVGGAEHAVLHLLYARFFTKVLFDAGLVSFEEPFHTLRNQGMILGPDHQKMSKSKGNVITQDEVIAQYGADALRLYELFMGPFDQEKPWDTKGIVGVRRFLDKIWRLQEKVGDKSPLPEESRAVHAAIAKLTEDLPDCRFNTAVAALMECANTLQTLPYLSREGYQNILRILSPLAPHLAEELWERTGGNDLCCRQPWPSYDPVFLQAEAVEYPIQINGRIKARVQLSANLKEVKEIEAAILADASLQALLTGKELVKTVVVPGRLVSLVVKET